MKKILAWLTQFSSCGTLSSALKRLYSPQTLAKRIDQSALKAVRIPDNGDRASWLFACEGPRYRRSL